LYRETYDSPIGEDGYCGPEWEEIGHALDRLLSADIGQRLDAGTLDSWIRETLVKHGRAGEW